MDPVADINRISVPLIIKRKYTRRKLPEIASVVVDQPVESLTTAAPQKPKRKYTRKNLPTIAPVVEHIEPAVINPSTEIPIVVSMQKTKRKYIRKPKNATVKNTLEPIPTPIHSPVSVPIVEPIASQDIAPSSAMITQTTTKPKRKYTRRKDKDKTLLNIQEMPKPNKPLSIDTDLPITNESAPMPPAPPQTAIQPMYFDVKSDRLNERFVELMDDLSYIMRKRKDMMRARAYNQAKETILTYDGDITDPAQLKGKPGIGNTIFQKLVDYTKNGTLPLLEAEKETILRKRAMEIFINIYGVGDKKAEEIVSKGITTIEELKQREMELLNDKQRIGLKYYHDILERIPREEIILFETIFRESITPDVNDLKLEIVGSYRRGLSNSGDIDVILTSENPQHFSTYIDHLLKKNIILEILSRGPSKCLVIAKLPESPYARRVDFLYTSPQEFPFSILYFTGSKTFNTTMREHALKMNYTLNEHGLSHMIGRTKGALVDHVFTDETSIFDFLNLQYKTPQERIDGKAVIIKTDLQPDVRSVIPVDAQSENIQISMEPTMAPTEPIITMLKPEKKRRISKKNKPILNIEPVIPTEQESESAVEIQSRPSIRILEEPEPAIAMTTEITNICKITKKSTLKQIDDFKMSGIQVLETLTENELAAMLSAANTAFHCTGNPIMTDAEYDVLHDFIEKKFPDNSVLKSVGAPIQKNKVKLPYDMWSMDKIKPDSNALVEWKKKYTGDYVVSCKLDGISALYSTEGIEHKLYTRGNGKVGEDISYLIPYLKLPQDKNVVIRGELVIKREVFAQKYASKYANTRNLVAGIANAKTLDNRISDVDFVAYEVIQPSKLSPSKQMALLSTLNVTVVHNKTFSDVTNESLSSVLQDWRQNYTYDIDGIIVSNDRVYPRTSGNPEHSFAFKMVLSDQVAETHVVGVEWNASKDGYLKPRIRLEPIKLGGVTIEYTTGFNGEFISKNRIGVGAIVKIVRSGDVIPYIKEVTSPAEHAMMPTVAYHWNDTHVDIILDNIAEDPSVRERNIVTFFKSLNVKGVGEGNVKRMVQSGYDTVPKILHMTQDDFLKVEGFQLATAKKLLENIHESMEKASLPELMVASNKFGRGFGMKKIELIMESYPTVLKPEERKIEQLALISGMSKTSAEEFVNKIPDFLNFVRECGLEEKMVRKTPQPLQQPRDSTDQEPKPASNTIIGTIYNMIAGPQTVDTAHPLYGKTVVISGFTDKDRKLETKLKYVGAKMGSSVSKKTSLLVVKSEEEQTGKYLAAKELGIPVYTIDNFMKKYFQKEGIEEVEHPV